MIRIKPTPPAFIVLSETMLNKAIIDANGTIRQFGRLFGIDFDEMEAGDRTQVDAEFLDGTPTMLSFYKTRNRGDRRFRKLICPLSRTRYRRPVFLQLI